MTSVFVVRGGVYYSLSKLLKERKSASGPTSVPCLSFESQGSRACVCRPSAASVCSDREAHSNPADKKVTHRMLESQSSEVSGQGLARARRVGREESMGME